MAVRDHLGPHGPQRCVVGLVDSLKRRIDEPEQTSAQHDQELRCEQDLHVERQNALLTQIDTLEERIANLQKRSDACAVACSCSCWQFPDSAISSV